jgi:hypothetical protein
VVAPEGDYPALLVELSPHRLLDQVEHRLPTRLSGQITQIAQIEFTVIRPVLAREVRRGDADRPANQRWRSGRPAQMGGILVPRNTKQ